MNQSTKLTQKLKQRDFKSYRKVGRVITKWGAIEKSPIFLSQFELTYPISPFKRIGQNLVYDRFMAFESLWPGLKRFIKD